MLALILSIALAVSEQHDANMSYYQSAVNSLQAFKEESDNSQFFLDGNIAIVEKDLENVENSRTPYQFDKNVDTLRKDWDEMKVRELIWTHHDII